MSTILHIRRDILGLTQRQLADICGRSQGTVSKWEKGELSPSLDELMAIRTYAGGVGKALSDSAFFDLERVDAA